MTLKHVVAGVVLFKPDKNTIANILSYSDYVAEVYIFDNSPTQSEPIINELQIHKSIHYFTEGVNVGIAKALNRLSEEALQNGYSYILTMDQDSFFERDTIKNICPYIGIDEKIAIVTPRHLVKNDVKKEVYSETEFLFTTITSGSIVNLSIYKKIGGYCEKLFIDYVDHEFCLRIHQHGFTILQVNSVCLNHTIGELTEKKFLWMFVHPSNHNSIRWYYQTRNRLLLEKKYYSYYPEFFVQERIRYWKKVAKMLLFEKEKIKKIIMIVRGFIAAYKNDFSNL